jgi:flagella basal body P-ring formation protein FlgA
VDTPVSLVSLRYTPGNGGFAARFMIAGIDQPVDLTGAVDLMTSVPRLSTALPAGAILGAADFETASVPLAVADASGYADVDQLVGRELIRAARAGLMLRAADVRAPATVKRNSVVTVLLRSGPMTLTVKGTALGTAAAGEPVDVLNTVSRKVLHGVARADGTVEIPTALTVAGL